MLPEDSSMHEDLLPREMVMDVVIACRHGGLDRAFEQAADVFGQSIRRIKAIWYNEVARYQLNEILQFRRAYADWIDQEMARLEQRRSLLAARQELLKGAYAMLEAAAHAGRQSSRAEAAILVAARGRARAVDRGTFAAAAPALK